VLQQTQKSLLTRNVDGREARLDREKGEWTVRGVADIGGPAPKEVWEVDWKCVVRYSPSNGRWEGVFAGWNGINDGLKGQRRFDGLWHPTRYGWRPLGEKDGKGR
jgi:hypothetical protein